MNGHDQDCPGPGVKSTSEPVKSKRPNKYGIEGFMNADAECGDKPGLFLGIGSTSSCRCQQYTYGNPDADDGLNELIIGRYVLIPK
jgi:hypothetical protein